MTSCLLADFPLLVFFAPLRRCVEQLSFSARLRVLCGLCVYSYGQPRERRSCIQSVACEQTAYFAHQLFGPHRICVPQQIFANLLEAIQISRRAAEPQSRRAAEPQGIFFSAALRELPEQSQTGRLGVLLLGLA